MTLEIIVFILAILFGIVWYWRESKSNKTYRFFNKLMHTKKLQMTDDNRKGFVHLQPFLMRLVWVTLFFVGLALLVSVATPINGFYVQYFVSAIVGTLIGTYLASTFFVASEGLKKENIDKMIEKGKEYVEELTEGDEPITIEAKDVPEALEENTEEPQKSARDRLKDKGMIK